MTERQADQKWVEDARAENLRRAREATAFGRFERGHARVNAWLLAPFLDAIEKEIERRGLAVPGNCP